MSELRAAISQALLKGLVDCRLDILTPAEHQGIADHLADQVLALPGIADGYAALPRVQRLAAHYEASAEELPPPHGRVTEAFSTAARDIRRAIDSRFEEPA